METQEFIPAGKSRDTIIETVKLTKTFGDVTAVDEISFALLRGELFGFLGPNGAGKTTTINMLTGLSRPDSGKIRIAGQECTKNPKGIQHLIGIVPDESNLYPELSGFENLCFCASLYGLRKKERRERAAELLEIFGLKKEADRKFGGYSRGMKRKLTIAAGIIHRPQILFLDEPTTGIDVASARQIRQLIADLNRTGTTIFLTTHYIEEAERLCERIAFIVKGRIVRTDSVKNLLQPILGRQVMLVSVSNAESDLIRGLAAAFPSYAFESISPEQIRVESPEPIRLASLVRYIDTRNVVVKEARLYGPSLEDVFVRVTGIEADALKKEAEKKGATV
ncbi:ABC-2 type transport system ATP-binding protein [Syntrophus gentianae]|uniref:ABC-2 type transport system ATP-binding protein n=1 Tax=Syntrophus gentianae TaxID=43775 RepID=A0A1H7ZWK0_9BACT|nr:ATP-binding cassette domain-containing protein [Syntrophus gentianae]SEM62840.1 ABC-2 type transport system ATP-binding protein [Syntrophus gentianae]